LPQECVKLSSLNAALKRNRGRHVMPSHVRIFFGIIVVVAAYWILSGVWRLTSFHGRPITDAAIFIIVGSQIILGLIYLIPAWLAAFHRQNWARWVFAVIVVSIQVLTLSQFLYVYLYGSTERFRQVGQILLRGYFTNPRSIAVVALLIAAIIFIFTGNARDWFKKPSAS
jgi:hypothetical protein